MNRRALAVPLLALLAFPACTRLYYNAMEKIGKEKRDILVSRVKDARQDQEEARQQFRDALEAFQALTGFQGGDLEKTYNKLNSEYEDCEKRANDVKKRIASIEQVSKDLFAEWEKELAQIDDRALRTQSRKLLAETRTRYAALHKRMAAAEERMQPVLRSFQGKVLFLKHNLNAKAIASLKKDALEIDNGVAALVKDLEASIAEADAFISSMTADEAK
jgi:hypothetical protein